MKGLADLQVEKQNRIPQLRVEADHERAKLYGLTPAHVTGALEGMSNGRTVSQVVTEGNRRFDVVIRLSDTDRSTIGIADLLGRDAVRPRSAPSRGQRRGDGRPQSDTARERSAPHRGLRQYATATRDRAQIVADIRGILAETQWPQGYGATLEGTYQAYEDAALRIGILSLASLAADFSGAAEPLSLVRCWR